MDEAKSDKEGKGVHEARSDREGKGGGHEARSDREGRGECMKQGVTKNARVGA